MNGKCPQCEQPFQATHANQRYCTPRCSDVRSNERTRVERSDGTCAMCLRTLPPGRRKWCSGKCENLSYYGVVPDARIQQEACSCEICGVGGPLVVDHDHESGQMRGWLCNACNSGLGFFKDNIETLARAIAYLTQ